MGRRLASSLRDLLPIILVVGSFQVFVFRQPLENFAQVAAGLLLVTCGLTLFVLGLEMGMFPVGEQLAHALARKGSLPWLLVFAFALGFGTTFAEPALIAVAGKAGELRALDLAADQRQAAQDSFAFVLRTTVAVAVGIAFVVGVLRIALGWPLHYIIMAGYGLVVLITPLSPASMIAIAYDSGGVTTSTITVPLAAALGVGLASSIRGRNPLLDGFGLIAFASLTPILFVLVLGVVW